ncbi:MAG: hypothetical protein HC903_17480 [Methylacidiphilales bacterium]|nr:hypothetical protein [Candidatus Methylacidiphilales bacterium]NJR16697.1 hypothetical protein [Calothrix sp. CSU_2_0]
MLKKSLILGLLAAIAIAPAAFAGNQTQENADNTNISATNVGRGNKIRIINRTYVIQSQGRRARKLLCQSPSNQAQGNVTNTAIAATNIGNRNRIRINNVNSVVQGQSVDCSKK